VAAEKLLLYGAALCSLLHPVDQDNARNHHGDAARDV
jgi:hypothetical protein